MTTIAVVRKGNQTAIAADTMTKWGTGKESAKYIANNDKIVRAGDTWIGAAGGATFKIIMRDYFARPKVKPRFDTTLNIFKTWQALHTVLKDDYFLVTGGDKDDTLESSRFDVLMANPHGIFGVGARHSAIARALSSERLMSAISLAPRSIRPARIAADAPPAPSTTAFFRF